MRVLGLKRLSVIVLIPWLDSVVCCFLANGGELCSSSAAAGFEGDTAAYGRQGTFWVHPRVSLVGKYTAACITELLLLLLLLWDIAHSDYSKYLSLIHI